MNMSNWFLRMGMVYLVLGVAHGIVMAASHDFTLRPVHVHLNLLGWAVMFAAGLWYRLVPASAATRLAKVHFWIHSIGMPILLVTLTLFYAGNKAIEPVLGIASIVVGVGILCFAINLWKYTESSSQ